MSAILVYRKAAKINPTTTVALQRNFQISLTKVQGVWPGVGEGLWVMPLS